MGATTSGTGPDLSEGLSISDVPVGGTLAGRVADDPVLLSNFDGQWFAVSGACTHYGGVLADGIFDDHRVRCPLHHACFDLRTGAAIRTPALDPLDRWLVEVEGDRVFVRRKLDALELPEPPGDEVGNIVIVGGGAAGLACAHELRRLGFKGAVTLLSADTDPPCDRPNLSKDYLAGTAAEEWLWLRDAGWYADNSIDLRLSTEVSKIDAAARTIECRSGEQLSYARLLIATGAEPNRLDAPGFDRANVYTLRSVADARSLSGEARAGARAVIIGASFIGLEAAAALRHRNVEVDIVSVEEIPLEHVFGRDVGHQLQALHETQGVRFHLSCTVVGFDGREVELGDGIRIPADFVLVAIGVRPRVGIAQAAGAAVRNGVVVNSYLETSLPDIYAAGDIAAYPEPVSGEIARIEHWVVAERQGQLVAANMLGARRRFESVPFFWTEQYGVSVRYVGRASGWDAVTVEGDLARESLLARLFTNGTHCATATIGRDRDNLDEEILLESRTRF